MSTSWKSGKRVGEPKTLWIIDLGRQDYERTRELQKRMVRARLEERIPDVLLLLEHDPVFTTGRHGGWENLLLSRKALLARGIPCIRTERGGDITYHGPGQLVGYPIVRVAGEGRKVKALVEDFEDVLLRTLARFGIRARRDPGNPGIWVGKAKIGSIGLAVRRGVSFHGFSLNVGMDLEPFDWIHACGKKNLRLTSLEAHLGEKVPLPKVKRTVASLFARGLGYRHAVPEPAELQGMATLALPSDPRPFMKPQGGQG